MNWRRAIEGQPGRGLGRARWPFTTVAALVAAGLFAVGGQWVWAVVLVVAAVVLGTLTFRGAR